MRYRIAPGVVLEAKELSKDDLLEANRRYRLGQKRATIAKAVGAKLVDDDGPPRQSIAVDVAALVDAVGVETAAELASVPVEMIERLVASAKK